MKIFVATDVNIVTLEGKIYANQKYSTILRRYYNAFGPIVLCSRFGVADSVTNSSDDITDIIDSIVGIQSLYCMFLNKYNLKIQRAMKDCDIAICRCPAISAFKTADVAKKIGKPYITESMGDAWNAYWNHGVLGKMVAPYMFLKMKHVVKNANYAVYVTNKYLQNRYPCNNKSIAASNVLIEDLDEKILNRRLEKLKIFNPHEITLMTTAAVDVKYKGQQYVIKAISKLNKMNIRVKYYIVGEGKNDFLKQIATQEGVTDQIVFTGRLPLKIVFELLDETDIYLQPSLQEGLPRSVIEALSRGCSCIGSDTAGIPELLQKNMIVRRKNVDDIVKVISWYTQLDNDELMEIAITNWNKAKQYSGKLLDNRRNDFFEEIIAEISR